jgi:glycosyltransferase involved in cell wall biosynthesis
VKITHLNTFDGPGGAAKAAYRLHQGLRGLGHESRMVVRDKLSEDPTVITFQPPLNPFVRLRRVLTRRELQKRREPISSRPAAAPYFSDDRSEHAADVLRQIPQSDIVNLHWVAGLFDYENFFSELPAGLPIVWTLHDMNPFTGGCHFDDYCGRFVAGCGLCPQLGSRKSPDLSSEIWARKKRVFDGRNSGGIHFVTPSRWLAEELKRSALLQKFPATVIPNGIDTETFQPRNQQMARQRLDLPSDAKVVLFLAHATTEKRKGFDLFLKAAAALRADPQVFVMVVGHGAEKYDLGPRARFLESVDTELGLSFVYSAADVFVLPSLQDNFPNTAVEALACGLPIVAFNVGGLPDIVRDCTGVLVEPGNTEALSAAILTLLNRPDVRRQMSAKCRSLAIAEYSAELQAKRYLDLYASCLTPHSELIEATVI